MAFLRSSLALIAGGTDGAPNIYSYSSAEDTLEAIEASGYFDEIGLEVNQGEIILVVDSTSTNALLTINISGSVISTTRLAPGASHLNPIDIIIADADYDVSTTDLFKAILLTAGSIDAQLPASADTTDGFVLWINNTNAADSTTITPDGDDTINGIASVLTLEANEGVFIMKNDTNWVILTEALGAIAAGTVTSVDTAQPAAGLTVTGGPITAAGTFTFALADDLAAVEALADVGFAVRTAADTWKTRTLVGTTNQIDIVDANGVANPPVFSISATYAGQASIVTVGAVTSGAWRGTPVQIAYGGTGQATATAGFNALSPLTTAGDLVGRNATNNVRVPVGTNGQILTADSTLARGLAWKDDPGDPWTAVIHAGNNESVIPTQPGRVGRGTSSYDVTMQFRNGQDDNIQFKFFLPPTFVTDSDIEIIIAWEQDSAGVALDEVNWRSHSSFVGDGGATVPVPILDSVNTVIPNATSVMKYSTLTITGNTVTAAGQVFTGQILRQDSTNPDTYADDALVSIVFFREVRP